MTQRSDTLCTAGDLLAAGRDPLVHALRDFVLHVLCRSYVDVGWFSISYTPALVTAEVVFTGPPPHECVMCYLWQKDDNTWAVYQFNRYYKERHLF